MADIQLTKDFTTDERGDDIVSIALVLSAMTDELWRRSFDKWINDSEWLAGSDGVIVGYSFPFSYDGTSQIEIRTHHSTIERALTTVSVTIDKVNAERAEALDHNPKALGAAESKSKVQAWFDLA